MKLKRVSCTQFAGVRDFDLSLSDGMNVIYGKNESGKSTFVHLLSRTLFQNAKLDGRRDKEFLDLYFPAAKRGSPFIGDFVDGKVVLESEYGSYTLSKEWGAEARSVLSAPDGVIRDQTAIDNAMKELLVYGEGVYTDILLSPQNAGEASLRTLLDASKKTDAKQEIIHAVSQAVSEFGGISIDSIAQAIEKNIEELAGKHWDAEKNAPVRKAGRWATGLGEVLKAYYRMEDAKAVLKELANLEDEADRAAAIYAEKDKQALEAQMTYEDFRAYADKLSCQSALKKELMQLQEEMQRYEHALSAWPLAVSQCAAAKILHNEEKMLKLHEKFTAAKQMRQQIDFAAQQMEGKNSPSAREITDVRTSLRRVSTLENKLCGMNLSAAADMLQGHSIEVRTVRTGELLNTEQNLFSITEAVTISVPGVMALHLAPADVNVADLESKILQEKSAVQQIFRKYEVASLEELEELQMSLSRTEAEQKTLQTRLEFLLGETTFEELARETENLPVKLRDATELRMEIADLCGTMEIGRFITARETVIEGYEREYGKLDLLQNRLEQLMSQSKLLKEQIAEGMDIPAQYLSISEPAAHLRKLEDTLEIKRQAREEALTAKASAISRLETYKAGAASDPKEEFEKAEIAFSEKNDLLKHWLHIAEVFAAQKETVRNDPTVDIAEHFAKNLDRISGGRVSSEFSSGDKLDMQIYSRDRLLDFGKLSEGTKETVALAFRLAIVDHLFPEGGGLIVLDDPLTDMDAERTQQACALIKESAKRHQVIFLTCKEEYANFLEAKPICLPHV